MKYGYEILEKSSNWDENFENQKKLTILHHNSVFNCLISAVMQVQVQVQVEVNQNQ